MVAPFKTMFSEAFALFYGGAGWSSPVARQAHNLKVVGSNPTPATKCFDSIANGRPLGGFLRLFG